MLQNIIEKLNGHTFTITDEMLNGYEKTPIGEVKIICEDGSFNIIPEILLGVIINGESIFYERFKVDDKILINISETLDVHELCVIDNEVYELLKDVEVK